MFSVTSRSRVSYATNYEDVGMLEVKKKARVDRSATVLAQTNRAAIFEEEYQHVRRLQELDNTEVPGMDGLTFSELRLRSREHMEKTRAKLLESFESSVSKAKKEAKEKIAEQKHKLRLPDDSVQEKRRRSRVKAEIERLTKSCVFLKSEDYDVKRAKRAFFYHDDMENEENVAKIKSNLSVVQSTATLYEKWKLRKDKRRDIQLPAPDVVPKERSRSDESGLTSSGDESIEVCTIVLRDKSVYDLPIEFHKKMLMQASGVSIGSVERVPISLVQQASMPSTVSGAVHRWKQIKSNLSILSADLQRKYRFASLNPEVLAQALVGRRNFSYVRPLSLKRLQEDNEIKINMLSNLQICKLGVYALEDLPYQVFSWSKEDFTERQKLNPIWVDIMRQAIPPSCLQKLKLIKDLSEFKIYMGLFFKALLNEDNNPEIYADVIEIVESCFDFLQAYELMRCELEENTEALRLDVLRVTNALVFHFDSTQIHKKDYYVKQMEKHAVVDPIEIRYQIRYFAAAEEGIIHRLTSTEVSLQKELVRIQRQVESESYVSQCILNTYYMSVERYKAEIAAFTEKYHMEYESLEAEISNKKLSIEKIRQQIIFFTEQIQRFHEEFEDLRLEQIEQQLQEERCKREEEAMRLERNQRSAERSKSKKKKKSKK